MEFAAGVLALIRRDLSFVEFAGEFCGLASVTELHDAAILHLFRLGAKYQRPMDLPDTTGLCWREGIYRCLGSYRSRVETSPRVSPLAPFSSSSSPLVLRSSSSLVPPSSSSSRLIPERRREPALPERRREPAPAPRLRPPVPAPRQRPPVPAPRLRPPVPPALQSPCWFRPALQSPCWFRPAHQSPCRPRPAHQNPEWWLLLSTPLRRGSPREFWGGATLHGLPSFLLCHGGISSSLLRHGGIPSTLLRRGRLSPRIRRGRLSPRIRRGRLSPRIRRGRLSPRIRRGRLSPRIRRGRLRPRIRRGRLSPRIRRGRLSPRIRHVSRNGHRPGGHLSGLLEPWGLQSAHPPSPFDVIRRGTRLLEGGGNVTVCLPLPLSPHPYMVLPVSQSLLVQSVSALSWLCPRCLQLCLPI